MMIGWVGGQTDEYVTLPPPPGWRVPCHNRNSGEGGWAPWRLMQGRDTGEASMADRESQVAMADREPQVAMADREPQVAMADREPQVAMANREPQVAMADREPQVAMADREPRTAKAYFFRVARAGQGAPWPWS